MQLTEELTDQEMIRYIEANSIFYRSVDMRFYTTEQLKSVYFKLLKTQIFDELIESELWEGQMELAKTIA